MVIGCGGVGLNVIQGCALAGASVTAAADVLDKKLEFAIQFGATHTINPGRQELIRTVRGLTEGRGADHRLELTPDVRDKT